MRSLKKKRRIQVLSLAGFALLLAAVLIGYGFRDGINLYRSPSQIASEPPREGSYFQLGGLVKDGSITPVKGVSFDFVITDGGADMPVRYIGRDPRPDLFTEGQGTIAKGHLVDGIFMADNLLAKHDENYMPREVIDSLKEQGVYKEPTT